MTRTSKSTKNVVTTAEVLNDAEQQKRDARNAKRREARAASKLTTATVTVETTPSVAAEPVQPTPPISEPETFSLANLPDEENPESAKDTQENNAAPVAVEPTFVPSADAPMSEREYFLKTVQQMGDPDPIHETNALQKNETLFTLFNAIGEKLVSEVKTFNHKRSSVRAALEQKHLDTMISFHPKAVRATLIEGLNPQTIVRFSITPTRTSQCEDAIAQTNNTPTEAVIDAVLADRQTIVQTGKAVTEKLKATAGIEATVIGWTDKPKAKPKPKLATIKPETTPTVSTNGTHANGAVFTDKRPGVLAVLVIRLSDASEAEPVTKKQILATLVRAFPDRESAKMWATIQMQVPSGLKTEKKLILTSKEVSEGDKKTKGYWIDQTATEAYKASFAK